MTSIVELLENELKAAFEIKNEQSLHNYVLILVEKLVRRDDYMTDSSMMKSDLRISIESMQQGFKRMDERFEAVDKRFEDLIGQMNSRFNMMFCFISGAFAILTILMTVYRFIG